VARSISELPNLPAACAMFGGGGRSYVAYVGVAEKLKRPAVAGRERPGLAEHLFWQEHSQRRRSRDLALLVRLDSRFLRLLGLRPAASSTLRRGFMLATLARSGARVIRHLFVNSQGTAKRSAAGR
jgi:hypothetical protein